MIKSEESNRKIARFKKLSKGGNISVSTWINIHLSNNMGAKSMDILL